MYSMGLTAEISLRISARQDARVGFVVEELRELAEMLPKMQDYCDEHQAAIPFEMPIGSGGSALA